MATGIPFRKVSSFLSLLFMVVAATASAAFPTDLGQTQFDLLNKELSRYYSIQKSGGWNTITLNKKYYMRGQSAPAVKELKNRLRLTGQFTSEDNSPLYTDELAQAVKLAQKQFGLTETGSLDGSLVKELNVPVEKRIEQLRVNMERTRTIRIPTQGTTLIANIPEYRLHVYENGSEMFNMAIVAGKSSTRTPVFQDQMTHIVFSPYWNVPRDIVVNEILPAGRSNKNYLRNNGYEIVGRNGGVPDIRQKPGANNSLGRVKFMFPNSYNVYFHDTPAKSLFKFDKRAASHGCVRLAEPAKLAQYLLRNDPTWNSEKIAAAMQSGIERSVKLKTAANVVIAYFTAWVDDEGGLNFREDIYGHDKDMAKNLSNVAVASL